MSWDDTKISNDDFLSGDWNDMVTDQKARALVESGAGALTGTPTMIGSLYYDTTNLKFYISAGISGASDWKKVITQ
jgi:hypothetical protein